MARQRIVVVTGGGSGMGRAIARRFATAGDTVYVLGRHMDTLQETAKGFASIECIQADVTDLASIKAAHNAIATKHKAVDVLVNNAGASAKTSPNPSLEEAADTWDNIITGNLSGTFNMTFAFVKSMKRPGGRIISISSMAAFAGSSAGGVTGQAYAASKAGVHGLSRTLARALASEGVTVNCVAPGVIDHTGFFGGTGVPEERKDTYLPTIPQRRFGEPDDVAEAVFYLASDKAGYVTGEILNVNGGAVFGR